MRTTAAGLRGASGSLSDWAGCSPSVGKVFLARSTGITKCRGQVVPINPPEAVIPNVRIAGFRDSTPSGATLPRGDAPKGLGRREPPQTIWIGGEQGDIHTDLALASPPVISNPIDR